MCSLNAKQNRRSVAADLFVRADKEWDLGNLTSAFRLFLAAAKAGDKGAQLNLGYFYDKGIGVRGNKTAALYWYRKAYRRGDASAAANIATIWRDERRLRRALSWFQRAADLGDDGSNLEIAKHYLRNERDVSKAIRYLKKVCKSNRVAQVEAEEAKRLLKEVRSA